jgi:hypothetical protein
MIPIAQDIANEIRLQRFAYAGCFLIVEGDYAFARDRKAR